MGLPFGQAREEGNFPNLLDTLLGNAEIVHNLYQVGTLGASAFVALDGQVTVIDSGPRWTHPRLTAFLDGVGRSPQEIAHIVATHYHPDHIGSMARLREASSARVAVHEAEAPFVEGVRQQPNPFQHPLLAFLASPLVPLSCPPPVAVDIALRDGDTLPVLGGLQVVHSPGHTPGSISLYFPAGGILIVGDALECRGGRLGPPNPMFTVNMEQAKASIRRLAEPDIDILCFSHFPPIRRGAGRALREFAESLG